MTPPMKHNSKKDNLVIPKDVPRAIKIIWLLQTEGLERKKRTNASKKLTPIKKVTVVKANKAAQKITVKKASTKK